MSTESNHKKIVLPTLQEIVSVNDKRITAVNWNKDFYLVELLDNGVEIATKSNTFKLRSRLYNFLCLNRVLSKLSPEVKSGSISAYKRRKDVIFDSQFRDGWRIGPSHNGTMYYFGEGFRAIAENWIEAYNERNINYSAFIPDTIEKAL